jgi:hypothetical protein
MPTDDFIKPITAQKQVLFIKQLNLMDIIKRLRSMVKEKKYIDKKGKKED